jgi:peptidoglycan hydrolase CwlO-like protein
MIEKVDIKQVLYIGVACLAINFLFGSCGKSEPINQLQTDTDRTMGTIKAEQSSVGVEINRSQVATANAIEAISRSQTKIDESREAVGNLNAGIAKLQAIIGECEELARKNKVIFDRVDGANQ